MIGNLAAGRGSRLQQRLVDLVEGMKSWAAAARAHHALREEFEALDQAGYLDEVLHDSNLSRSDLEALINADPKAPERLERMLAKLGLAERLQRDWPAVLHDVQKVCGICQTTSECEHWLRGEREGGIEAFCPNADTFAAIRAEKG